MKEIKTTLICSHCFKESPVRITYLEESTVKLTCERCGHTIRITEKKRQDLSLTDLELRILTKPLRLALEAKKDSFRFVSTLPLRMLIKPFRIARELKEVLSTGILDKV
ncbi:hypothetical protein J7L81_03120 [Candidatus Aerophobetes bacterium]|nr:hypothetical protein [Candidatus Aerophobetes bacterium]